MVTDKFTLVIGNKDASSWSMRAWLMLRQAGVPFNEIIIQLGNAETRSNILEYSPTGKVPVLIHNDLVIHESLAIGEYLNELFPEAQLLPENILDRAYARSLCSEMHAGFIILRKSMPFTLQLSYALVNTSYEVQQDIDRIIQIWQQCRSKYYSTGDYLLGKFGMVDAMFAPVVLRFKYYNIPLQGIVKQYAQLVEQHRFVREWVIGA
jgi:glutathione S-transferase